MDTVKESKLKLHSTFYDSESTHLNSCTVTGILLIPTSTNDNIERMVVIATNEHVMNCDPTTPTFLPKKPETTEPSKGNAIIVRYIS